jgi:hypothetical protein
MTGFYLVLIVLPVAIVVLAVVLARRARRGPLPGRG